MQRVAGKEAATSEPPNWVGAIVATRFWPTAQTNENAAKGAGAVAGAGAGGKMAVGEAADGGGKQVPLADPICVWTTGQVGAKLRGGWRVVVAGDKRLIWDSLLIHQELAKLPAAISQIAQIEAAVEERSAWKWQKGMCCREARWLRWQKQKHAKSQWKNSLFPSKWELWNGCAQLSHIFWSKSNESVLLNAKKWGKGKH